MKMIRRGRRILHALHSAEAKRITHRHPNTSTRLTLTQVHDAQVKAQNYCRQAMCRDRSAARPEKGEVRPMIQYRPVQDTSSKHTISTPNEMIRQRSNTQEQTETHTNTMHTH